MLFTIVFAALVLKERPRREQIAGAAIAFAGLAAIGVDRAASAPILPFVLIVAAAAAWGVTNVITRVAQPPDGLAMLVWASLVPPLPLLGLSLLFEGPGEIGDALAGSTPPAWPRCCSSRSQRAVRLRGLDDDAQAPHAASVTPFALLVPVFGMASAALLLGERPSALELRRRGADLRGARDAKPARARTPAAVAVATA